MVKDMLTIEGRIVNIDKTFRGRVEVGNDGIIIGISEPTGKADIVLKDELIFPGFIDLHVHARECADHSQDYKEDFVTAGQAAINGGVVAFADMPNNPVPPVDDKSYADKYQLAIKCPVEVVLYAGIGPKTKSLSKEVPYKVFMGKSVGDLFFTSFEELDSALEKYKGQSVSFHCEDPKVLENNKNQVAHHQRRPKEAELSAVDFALQVIEKYNLKGKICHSSRMETIQKINNAKKHGVQVSVEVTPHHLFFDQRMLSYERGEVLQVNPPIRETSVNKTALIYALKNNWIDYLATDHAPHTIQEKVKGISGIPHLDTYGPFVSWLIKEHGFTPEDIARVCSFNPGNFLNRFTNTKYGKIEPGYAGSLTVIDMNKPIKIDNSKLKTKAGWSPFENFTFPGSVTYTIIKGKVYDI